MLKDNVELTTNEVTGGTAGRNMEGGILTKFADVWLTARGLTRTR